jgi:hypothetical protein
LQLAISNSAVHFVPDSFQQSAFSQAIYRKGREGRQGLKIFGQEMNTFQSESSKV